MCHTARRAVMSGGRFTMIRGGGIAIVALLTARIALGVEPGSLADAAMNGDAASLQRLLKSGADVNERGAFGTPALHWRVRVDDLAGAKQLLAAGADVNATTERGVTALGLAIANGNAPMVALTRAICGEVHAALEDCAAIIAEAVRFGDPRSELITRDIEAMISLYRADYERMRQACDRGLALARQLGARRFEAELMTLQGHAVGEGVQAGDGHPPAGGATESLGTFQE